MSADLRGRRHEAPPTMVGDLWASVDPTLPARWRHVRPWGRAGAILGATALVGLPSAVLLDLFVLVLRGDRDLLFSLRHAIELMAVIWVIAPAVGALAGDVLWLRGEARSASGEV